MQVSIADVCLNEEMLRVGVGGLESIGEENLTRSVPNIQQETMELPESRSSSPVGVKRAESEPSIPLVLEAEEATQPDWQRKRSTMCHLSWVRQVSVSYVYFIVNNLNKCLKMVSLKWFWAIFRSSFPLRLGEIFTPLLSHPTHPSTFARYLLK